MTNTQTRTRAALYLTGVFVAGLVLGMAGVYVYESRWSSARRHLSSMEYRGQLLRHLTQDLDLDADQQRQVEGILDLIGERFRVVREAIEPEMEAIRSERAERIMAVLDRQQQSKYSALLEERRRREEHRRHRRRADGHNGRRR